MWATIHLRTTKTPKNYYCKDSIPLKQDIICLCYINENIVETFPKIQILVGNQKCKALLDIGCQYSITAELYKAKIRHVYSQLTHLHVSAQKGHLQGVKSLSRVSLYSHYNTHTHHRREGISF
jgi:hypothetical protein